MDFLIDASLPRSTASTVRTYGHQAVDGRDIGLGGSSDADIAAHAQANRLCLLTRDYDFADIRNYPPSQYAGIVVIELPATATAAVINQLVGDFLRLRTVLSQLPGRLAIVEPGRVRLRPVP
jgi:predicted nuclease of predicted toxin-antitoxin system